MAWILLYKKLEDDRWEFLIFLEELKLRQRQKTA